MARAQVGAPTEGELWARALLDDLRAGGFAPRAWGAFLDESLRRARVVRARRPELVRQSRLWGACGLAAAAPFGARPALEWAAWWALLDWHLGMAESPGGEPRPLRAQDALTLARLWAAPIARRHPSVPLVAAAALTDVADGALARRGGPTRLGRDFDSTADALFFDAVLSGAVARRELDPQLLAAERARVTAAGVVVLVAYFGRSRTPPPMHHRQAAAVLAALGAGLAAAGRPRAARLPLSAAIGYRSSLRWRASFANSNTPARDPADA